MPAKLLKIHQIQSKSFPLFKGGAAKRRGIFASLPCDLLISTYYFPTNFTLLVICIAKQWFITIFAVGKICNYSDQNLVKNDMQNAVVEKIRSKITHARFGEVFFASSFPKYDVEYVTKLLAVFENDLANMMLKHTGFVLFCFLIEFDGF